MNHNKGFVLIFACMFLGCAAWCAAKEEQESPQALISRARLEEDMWAEGSPPILMRADLQVPDAKGTLVHGDYTLDWVSPSRWREVIRFGNYERFRVRDERGYWQKNGLSYQPEFSFQLDTMLHPKDVLRVRSKQTLGKVRNRDKDGGRQKCAEVKWTIGTDRIMCFDEATGALVSIEYPRGENQNPPEISRIEYGSFKTVGGKLVPYEIRAMKDRKVIASVKVLEIAKITQENSALFDVPVNSEFWAQCDDLQDAELVDHVQPRFPASARANHESGRVTLYAVVEADGSLSHMAVIHRATADLDAASAEAIHHWRYKPAACGQTPIRVETSISIDFWLQY
jgi:TonB family protein